MQFDIEARKARILDGGEIKWSVRSIETIATAVVRVLQKEDETENRMLYIQSFRITQNKVLKSLERVTAQSWQAENVDSDEYMGEARVRLNQRDPKAQEDLVSALSLVDANWEGKDDVANSLLGLKTEDLHQVVREVIVG